ncbi:MAG TPA: retropepsin-like aspartic protease [Burkholderiales bacterium]|nr:retropepsin-like aspartic protease [Burkholderiales bacterium]
MRLTSVVAALLVSVPALAADISVNALFNNKAMLVIDGGKPRMLSAGQTTPEGVRLISANSEAAVVEYKGQRQTLSVGQGTRIGSGSGGDGAGRVTLIADSRGHFVANGSINGLSVRFLVDTGASLISLSTDEARRLGINYLAGERGYNRTANGLVQAYRVKVDNVRLGDITLSNVEASVSDGMKGAPYALLGMSFLNRTHMTRDGDKLTLVRRF